MWWVYLCDVDIQVVMTELSVSMSPATWPPVLPFLGHPPNLSLECSLQLFTMSLILTSDFLRFLDLWQFMFHSLPIVR